MSGAIHATIAKAGRESERQSMDRITTVRRDDLTPLDVAIIDISLEGCKIEGAVNFSVDDIVSIGLPGLGCISGRVVWFQNGQCGVAFFGRLEQNEIALTRDAQTVVGGSFQQFDYFDNTMARGREKRLPPWASALVIFLGAIASWALAIMISRPLGQLLNF